MQKYGTLVEAWPVILGCEASGVVLEVGSEVTRFKVGDGIFGCSRLGTNEYTTFQETFLMDEALSYKRPPGMSAEEASTVGVALDVCLYDSDDVEWLADVNLGVTVRLLPCPFLPDAISRSLSRARRSRGKMSGLSSSEPAAA